MPICDFCSAPDPTWRHPARNFIAYCDVAGEPFGESIGDWAACNTCHDLIEAEDRQALAHRSLDELISEHPEAILATDELLENLSSLHESFFENRFGAPSPVVI